MTLIIGVTGGIASGKSTLARMFVGRGIMHVDADKLVHELMQHDRDTIAAIAAAFPAAWKAAKAAPPTERHPGAGRGPGQATRAMHGMDPGLRRDDSMGAIDRPALAAHIAQHPQDLKTLESILHPRVRAAEIDAIHHAERNRLRAVILDIPLLFETDADALCDVVVVAHAPLSLRRQRAFRRPGMSEAKWEKLLARQLPNHHHHPAADVVIHTSIGKAATRREVERLMKRWGLK